MRQVASGFAIGWLSMALLVVPLLMSALNIAPDYLTAVGTLLNRAAVTAQLEHHRGEALQVTAQPGRRTD